MTRVDDIDTDKQAAQRLIDDWLIVQDKLNNRPATTPEIIDDVYFIMDRIAAGLKHLHQNSE